MRLDLTWVLERWTEIDLGQKTLVADALIVESFVHNSTNNLIFQMVIDFHQKSSLIFPNWTYQLLLTLSINLLGSVAGWELQELYMKRLDLAWLECFVETDLDCKILVDSEKGIYNFLHLKKWEKRRPSFGTVICWWLCVDGWEYEFPRLVLSVEGVLAEILFIVQSVVVVFKKRCSFIKNLMKATKYGFVFEVCSWGN